MATATSLSPTITNAPTLAPTTLSPTPTFTPTQKPTPTPTPNSRPSPRQLRHHEIVILVILFGAIAFCVFVFGLLWKYKRSKIRYLYYRMVRNRNRRKKGANVVLWLYFCFICLIIFHILSSLLFRHFSVLLEIFPLLLSIKRRRYSTTKRRRWYTRVWNH